MKKPLTVAILILVACMFLWIGYCWFNRPRISRQSFQRITIGSKKKEVKRILGKPRFEVRPMNAPTGLILHSLTRDSKASVIHNSRPMESWWGQEGIIIVRYENDIVKEAHFHNYPCKIRNLTLWEWLNDVLWK